MSNSHWNTKELDFELHIDDIFLDTLSRLDNRMTAVKCCHSR